MDKTDDQALTAAARDAGAFTFSTLDKGFFILTAVVLLIFVGASVI